MRYFKRKHKIKLRKLVPISSVLYCIATSYKQWKIKYIHGQDSFFSSYFDMKEKLTVTYNVAGRNILLSGDVQLNPGPKMVDSTCMCIGNPEFLFEYRLLRHGLRPLDVGGGGDCFFRSVSHQLYGDSSHHLQIRKAGIQYLTENPERFIESNVEASWLRYLTYMSRQGTWADHIIIQAIADAMSLKIHIIESDENFREMTLVEQTNMIENPRSIYIGHIGQMHYVSTLSALSRQSSPYEIVSKGVSNFGECFENDPKEQTFDNLSECLETIAENDNQSKGENNEIKDIRKRKQHRGSYMRQYRASKDSPEKRAKRNEYQRSYRQSKASPAKRAKRNEYQRSCRQSRISVKFSIEKFHETLNQGPFYVCTCCDQLWYKHSVLNANKLRQSIPDIVKYLYNKKRMGL